jgi:hypothetical protein
LCFVVIPATTNAEKCWLSGTEALNYRVCVRCENAALKPFKHIPWIVPDPSVSPPEAYSTEEKLAVFAELGHEIWKRIRASQDKYWWVQGYIEPTSNNYSDRLLWGRDQSVCVITEDGISVVADSVFALSAGEARNPSVPILMFPGGYSGFFSDILIEYPKGKRCDLLIAFPKTIYGARWEPKRFSYAVLTSDSEGGP